MLVGERVRLRAPERSDLPDFVRWLNTPEVRHGLALYAPMSMAQEEQWFERQLADTREHRFVIDVRDGESWRSIGTIASQRTNVKDANGHFGIQIGEVEAWGQGYGGEAVGLLLDFLFDQVNLHRVEMHVYEYNAKAIRCYEKLGFVHEGVERQAHFVDGQYCDALRMAILDREWRERRAG